MGCDYKISRVCCYYGAIPLDEHFANQSAHSARGYSRLTTRISVVLFVLSLRAQHNFPQCRGFLFSWKRSFFVQNFEMLKFEML